MERLLWISPRAWELLSAEERNFFAEQSLTAFSLDCEGSQWSLWALDHPDWQPLQLDFEKGAVGYRTQKTQQSHEPLRKILNSAGSSLRILDATAGLGQDAWMMAQWGHQVEAWEQNPILYFLLKKSFEKLATRGPVPRIVFGDSRAAGGDFDVIYLDPMYPEKKKTALPRKELRLLKELVGAGNDGPDFLAWALGRASKRVVVKRPLKAEALDPARRVDHQILGSTTRFDIYLKN